MIDRTILIIDDDAKLLELASPIFKKAGARVVMAHDGFGGLSEFFAHHPNQIILDVIISGQPRAGP